MGVAILGGGARRGEGGVEVVERGDRRGAEDAELEGSRRRRLCRAVAAESRGWMGDERLKGERAEVGRRVEDEPGERARLGLAERPSRPNPRPRPPSGRARPKPGARSRDRA